MVCISTSFGRRCSWFVFIVRKLMEWRSFHVWYQPREALNSESSENSFAFKRNINLLTAIPVKQIQQTLHQFMFGSFLVNKLVTRYGVEICDQVKRKLTMFSLLCKPVKLPLIQLQIYRPIQIFSTRGRCQMSLF